MTECLTECKALVTPSTRNGHRVFSYTLESHTAAAFAIMNELRLERQLCDVTLRVRYKDLEAVDFVAHKVVLASSSPVFRAMFTNGLKECGMELVPIEGIHPRVSPMSPFLVFSCRVFGTISTKLLSSRKQDFLLHRNTTTLLFF